MLSRDDLLTLYQRLGLSDEARSIIDRARSSDPARRVRSGRGNVSGRYPSKKMGVTIQFESHRVELAAIYEMENCSTTVRTAGAWGCSTHRTSS